jgi:predicted transcriptional regulator
MTDLAKQIRSKLDTLAADITALVREDALRQISDTFGGRTPSRSRKVNKVVPKERGAKRSADDLALMGTVIKTWVEKNPGMGVEQIAKGVQMDSSTMKLPIKKLLADGALKTKGQKRGTKYFVK